MGIKNKIIELGDNINIDLRPITHIMNKIGVHLIDASIVGTTPALCVPGKIYLDLNKIKSIRSYELVPFIMLHEIAHFKRYTNPYLDLDIKTRNIGLLSVDEYCDTVINEELFADRWASLMYYMIYKKQFPIKLTQKLGNKEFLDRYVENIKIIYKAFSHNGDDCRDIMLENFIKYVR